MSTPEEQAAALPGKKDLDAADVSKIYDALKPVKAEFLFGDWKGIGIETGHPGYQPLLDLKWDGKNFRSIDDVDPMVCLDEEGKRFVRHDWGHAMLRMVEYRGVVSAGMFYDNLPIIDCFRYVNENQVLAGMDMKKDAKLGGEAAAEYAQYANKGDFFFFLTRIQDK